MIREYCDSFGVIIPYKAHSAATMISLGADEVVMSDLSELSPIDPSTANVFNPVDPANPASRIPISVEDVVGFMSLAKDKFGIKDEVELTKVFNKFGESNPQIHPLALGNVNRTHNLIRLLAKRLLRSHQVKMRDEEIEKVVEFFTEKLFSHTYFIGRKEAKDELGLKSVVEADSELSASMSDLHEKYIDEMSLGINVWNPEIELGVNTSQTRKNYKIAFIESMDLSNHFEMGIEFRRQQATVTQQTPHGPVQVPQEQVATRVIEQGWK